MDDEERKRRNRERTAQHRAKLKAADPNRYFGSRREVVAKWREDNPEKYREQHLLRVYGMSLAEHDAILASQNGLCGACSAAEPGGRGNTWHVDHCHETGKIRGLLCRACNTAAGLANDNPTTLRAIADYIERNQ